MFVFLLRDCIPQQHRQSISSIRPIISEKSPSNQEESTCALRPYYSVGNTKLNLKSISSSVMTSLKPSSITSFFTAKPSTIAKKRKPQVNVIDADEGRDEIAKQQQLIPPPPSVNAEAKPATSHMTSPQNGQYRPEARYHTTNRHTSRSTPPSS